MFVGSIVTGNIYHFDLNEDRTQLVLTGELEDKIAETRKTGTEDIVFGEGFAGISDLEVGSDDYLYVVSLGQGKILRAMIHWTKRLLHVMTSLIVSDCRCCSGINFECFKCATIELGA